MDMGFSCAGFALRGSLHLFDQGPGFQRRGGHVWSSPFLGTGSRKTPAFLFFGEPSEGIVSELLKGRSDLQLLENYHFSYEQWQGAFSEPIKIDRFLIVPPWLDAVEGPGETKILLDPGLVFGTGLHASTRDSLKALSYVHSRFPIEKVIDLGTGTGVLALASALLGAQQVLAVDLNPLCVKTARKNVQWNHLESRIEVKEGRAEDFAELQCGPGACQYSLGCVEDAH